MWVCLCILVQVHAEDWLCSCELCFCCHLLARTVFTTYSTEAFSASSVELLVLFTVKIYFNHLLWIYQITQCVFLFFKLASRQIEMNWRGRNESAESHLLPSPLLLFCLLPHIISSPLTSSANELTVGKVYAALMIFDYYKQNLVRKQQQQQSAPGSQVQHPHHTCLYTTHTHDMHLSTHTLDAVVQTCMHAHTYIMLAHTDTHFDCMPACIQARKEGTFVSTS